MGTRIKISSNQRGNSQKSIQEIVEETKDPNSWNKCCIYRLPWCMKVEDNDKAYMPCLVSLGPYHYGNEQLQAMESHKYRALRCMLKRTHQDVDTYLHAAKELEQEARACYEDIPDDFSSEEFVEMLVVDSCFILEILLGYNHGEKGFEKLGYSSKDPVFSKGYMTDGILRDMILLENQIPLFVLDRLHGLKPEAQNQKNVVELAITVFNPSWVTARSLTFPEFAPLKEYILTLEGGSNIGMHHCLDIFRQTLRYCSSAPKSPELQERKDKTGEIDPKDQLIPSATQLEEAGVKFTVVKKTFPFWDVNFDRGNMEIPQIVINDKSESMFLNLMAFEQSHLPPKEAQITSYIALLDNLVNSPSDVAQLIEDEIVIHTLGSNEEVSDMLNRLAKGIYFSVEDGCYAALYEAVNAYSNKKVNQWRAKLMHDYFNSPWAIIAVIAAALELVLTFVQTVHN